MPRKAERAETCGTDGLMFKGAAEVVQTEQANSKLLEPSNSTFLCVTASIQSRSISEQYGHLVHSYTSSQVILGLCSEEGF